MISKIENITAVILVGGMGTRLRSVIGDKQKTLACVDKKPFVTHLLKQISEFGIKNIVLCVGYKADAVRTAIGTSAYGLKISYSEEKTPLGTGGALRLALSKIDTEYLLVMNGDSYVDFELNSFVSWHNQKRAEASLLLTRVKDVSRYGRVVINEDESVELFEEKGRFSGADYISTGVYLFKKNILVSIPEKVNYSLEKDFFPNLITNHKLYGMKVKCKFIDIGTPKSFENAKSFFKNITKSHIPKEFMTSSEQ